MRKKTELSERQKNLIEEFGVLMLPIHGGQVRRYGPSIYSYEIVDIHNQYEVDELLEFCTDKVHRAKLPIDPHLGLTEQVLEFKKVGAFTYYYKTGHDYTD